MTKQELRDELDSMGVDYPEDAKVTDLKQILKENQPEQENGDSGEQNGYFERPEGTNTNVNTTSEDFDPFTEVQSYGVSDPNQVNKGEREYNPFSADANHSPEYTGKESVPEVGVPGAVEAPSEEDNASNQ